MIAQYTQAAIVSELKRLAVPASVDSIPSSAMQEDHVSMGWSAARKLRRSVDGLTRVVAIEVLTAARALDLRRPLEPSPASEAVIAVLRAHGVEGPGPDRHLSPEIEAAVELVRSGAVLQAVEDRDRRTRMTTHQPTTPVTPRRAANPRLPIRAARGTGLTARSWQTEAPLRMLMNNLDPENAERPEDLVVYGGTGKAARSWEAYDALVRTLTTLGDDETMLVQSGKPVGVMRTHEWAPRVLIANSNLVGDWANWEEFRRLEDLGLTMYGQMTAGSWIYIGTQGILQGTFETFAAVADKRFGGTLAGTITVTAGLGGMGGAQPLAVTMNDGVVICIECDPSRIARRIEHRYLDVQADSLDEAVAMAVAARDERRPLSIGVLGNAAEMVPALLEQRAPIDIVTDQTSAHDPLYYLPVGTAFEDWAARAGGRPGRVHQAGAGLDGGARAGDGRAAGRGRRGVRLRQLDPRRGPQGRLRPGLRVPRLRAGLHPAAVLRGQGPVPVGGAVRRPGGHRGDRPGDPRAVPRQRAAAASGSRWPGSGSPSRACRRGSAGWGTASGTSRG